MFLGDEVVPSPRFTGYLCCTRIGQIACPGYRVFSVFLCIPYLLIVALIVIRSVLGCVGSLLLCSFSISFFRLFFCFRSLVSRRRCSIVNTHTRLLCVLLLPNIIYFGDACMFARPSSLLYLRIAEDFFFTSLSYFHLMFVHPDHTTFYAYLPDRKSVV